MIKLNDKLIEFKKFPNGETHFDGEQIHENRMFFSAEDQILFKYEKDEDLLELLFVKRYLDDNGGKEVVLILSYMPYSRMDRVEGFSVFTLKYISEFINSLNFSRVFLHEAHSDVTLALINRVIPLETTKELLERAKKKIDFNEETDYVFFPDASSQKRSRNFSERQSLVGLKKFDFHTSESEQLNIVGTMKPGQKVIIVDDMISSGETIMQSAEKLKELGAGDIYVVVAHAEEGVFNERVTGSDAVEKIFTTDSIIHESKHDKVEILMTVGWQEAETEEDVVPGI